MSKPMLKSNGAVAETHPPEPKVAVSAAEMGARQREISVSEFFTKNRHLLGFDNPRKALLTCVKEAVDNALDACEEAGILPDIVVKLEVAANGGPPPPAGHRHLGCRHVRPAHDRQARADHLAHRRQVACPLLRGPDRHQEERA